MSANTPLSPLRRILCSRSNAVRVAAWMRLDGIHTDIVDTGEPLQPWLIVETTDALIQDARACA
nr:hypothetical protein [Sphingomonas sp. H160509]